MALRKASGSTATAAKPAQAAAAAGAAAGKYVKIGRLDTYVSGGGLPEGDYVLFFTHKIHQAKDKNSGMAKGEKKLCVMVKAYDLNNLGADPKEEPYSLGSKAHLSYCPDPETGMRIQAIPGAPAGSLYKDSKWQVFLEELYNSGLPEDVFEDDLTAINGIHVHLHPIPEPDSWKDIRKGAAVSEAAMAGGQVNNKPMMVAVPTMILDGGKPWEGTGGLPKDGKAVAPKPAQAAAQAAQEPEAESNLPDGVTEEDLLDLASQACTAVLATPANANGMPKAGLKTSAFEWASKEYDVPTVSAMMDLVFENAENFSGVLGEIGYKVSKFKIEKL